MRLTLIFAAAAGTLPSDWPRQAPALARLLARGRQLAAEVSLTRLIARAFGLDDGDGLAAHSLKAEGLAAQGSAWLRADPVALHFVQDRLVFLHPADTPLQPAEADALAATLRPYLAAEGLELFTPHPQRWYLRLPAAFTAPQAAPPDALAGRAVEAHLPRGMDAAGWRRRLTELQMLLHDHPVNRAREAAGLPVINSLWFWGGGRPRPPTSPGVTRVLANHPLACALAATSGIGCSPPEPEQLARGRTPAMVILQGQVGTQLSEWDAHWFAPILLGLQRGRWREVSVYCTHPLTAASRLHTWDAYRFWRRPFA
ncbi:MAG: hypothetical protein NZ524_00445 [Thiobacillaceae bacterium]|nr:hypothetical protein [Thiobacillaceae bacterium]